MRALLATIILALAAGGAWSQATVWGAATNEIELYSTNVRPSAGTGVAWASRACLAVLWSGNVTNATTCNSDSTNITAIDFPRDVVITRIAVTAQIASIDTVDGCDIRLTLDEGATGIANSTISMPEADGNDFTVGEVFWANNLNYELSAGTGIQVQIADGTYSEATGTGDCSNTGGTFTFDYTIMGYFTS